MLRQSANGLPTYHFQTMTLEGLVHAVFTRLGGVSRDAFAALNVGNSVGDDPTAVAENHARIYARLGLEADQVATAHQVHGNRVAVVGTDDGGRVFSNTDGLVTNIPGVALLLRFADCQPIILYDPAHHSLGLIHAGWRGIAQGVAIRAVEAMQEAFGTRPSELIAGLGPAIGPCCYKVGDNVAAAMGYALPDWSQAMRATEKGWDLDLWAANAQQLATVGVQHIEQASLCTSCHNDEFFSHRADNGLTGRFAVATYLEPRDLDQEAPTAGTRLENTEPEDLLEPVSLNPPGFPAFGEFEEERP